MPNSCCGQPAPWGCGRPARFDGTIAWLLWGLIHISFLVGFRNRAIVMFDWLWSYVTFQSGARLITGNDQHQPSQ